MPRHKNKKFSTDRNRKTYKKNYNHVKTKGFNKGGSKINPEDASRSKKLKHMMRNKESEDVLRAQKEIEMKYRNKATVKQESSSESEEETLNPLSLLLSTFTSGTNNSKKSAAIESSSDESEDEMQDDGSNNSGSEEIPSDSENNENMLQDNFGDDLSFDDDASDDDSDSDEEGLNKSEMNEGENIDNEIVDDEEIDDDSEDSTGEINEDFETNNDEDVGDDIEDDDDDGDFEEDSDEEIKENGKILNEANTDPFFIHLTHDISPDMLEFLTIKTNKCEIEEKNWPQLGRLQIEIPKIKVDKSQKKKKSLIVLDDDDVFAPEGTIPECLDYNNINLKDLHVKNFIEKNVATANKLNLVKSNAKILNPLQSELFSIFNNYQDLYYSQRTLTNGEDIRLVYCCHALNHIVKTRSKILHDNGIIGKMNNKVAIVPDECKDQGLNRPKVLILLPFRESALRVVNNIVDLMVPDRGERVINYSRFVDEFSGQTIGFSQRNPKPEDYEQTFAGNTNDLFRIGLNLTKKCIKLYTDFYTSDILIASPLGLRLIIGAPGEEERDYDFLSSIELLILDQTELFHAQNWNHLIHLLEHLHLQPQSARNTDFSRVRSWHLNGWSRFYRQTLLFSAHDLPDFRSVFNKHCSNYRGKIRISNPIIGGSVLNVIVQIPQVFQRIDTTSWESSFDERFEHFIQKVLPQCKGVTMAHCLIYVPSYLDYVKIRNYLKKESVSFVQICEYTKDEKIARARDMFFHSSAHFLLYSERAHFFRRTRIKGIRHIIMYQPPNWPNFYPEMINFMQEANQNKRDGGDSNMSVTVLYTKYDMLQVASIVGSEKARVMMSSEKTTHLFMTAN